MSEQDQALQTLESQSVRRHVWCLLSWVKVHLAVWLQETLLTETSWNWYWNQTDACLSEDEDISAQSDSDTSDATDTNVTWRTDNTSRWPTVPVVHKFTGGPSGLQQRHPRSIKTLPHWAFSCFSFFGIIQLLVAQRNRFHQYLDTLDQGQSQLLDMTVQKMCLFLAIIVQMGHDQMGTLKIYRSILEQYFTALYINTMKQDSFYRILRFLHFSDNKNEPVRTWKLQLTVENESYIWQVQWFIW